MLEFSNLSMVDECSGLCVTVELIPGNVFCHGINAQYSYFDSVLIVYMG